MVWEVNVAETRLHFTHALLQGGWREGVRLTVAGGVIAAVKCDVSAQPGDERHAIAIPGMQNLHSHSFQRGMAGLAEVRGTSDDSFWTWRDTMYRFVDRMTPDDLFDVAQLAFIEMLEAGFTRVGEFHYLHHDQDGERFSDPAAMSEAVAGAAASVGIALTLLPVFYAHAGFGGSPPSDAQRRFVHDIDSFAALLARLETVMRDLPGGVLGVAPHSLRAVTSEELRQLEAIAGNRPIHIHIAEQEREVDECVAWSGARPVEWLLGNAPVDRRWCLVHATHVASGELEAIAKSDAVVGLCPVTEANLGDGIFPARAFQDAGGRFGIGSDSNVLIDMTEELRLLEYGQRLQGRGRSRLARGAGTSTGADLFDAALSGGAQALGATAGIAAGQSADLISIDVDHPSIAGKPIELVLDALIFAAGQRAIDCVWRAGTRVVSGGMHRDRQSVVARYKRAYSSLTA